MANKNIYDPPIGRKHHPCFPLKTALVNENDLVVIGWYVCRVYQKEYNAHQGHVLYLVRDPRYPDYETFNETRFVVYEKFMDFVWMYDRSTDLPL